MVIPGQELDQKLQQWNRAHHASATRTTSTGFAIWEFATKVTPAQIGLQTAF